MTYWKNWEGREPPLPTPAFLFPPVWSTDVMTEAPAALLGHIFGSHLVRAKGSVGGALGAVVLKNK